MSVAIIWFFDRRLNLFISRLELFFIGYFGEFFEPFVELLVFTINKRQIQIYKGFMFALYEFEFLKFVIWVKWNLLL